MEFMDPTLVAAPLPSLSPLSGTVQPATTAALLQTTWKQMQQKSSGVKRTGAPIGSLGSGQLQGLTAAAKQHVSSIHKTGSAPYSRVSTPQEKTRAEEQLLKQLQVLQTFLKKACQQAESSTSDDKEAKSTCANEPARPWTPTNMASALKELLPSRPATSMSVQDMTLPRPSSRASRFKNIPGDLTASWSGPLPTSDAHHVELSPCGTPTGGPCTPQRLRSRGGLRASAPSLMAALAKQSNHDPPQTWVNPMAQPASALDEQRALLRSSVGNRAVADATGSISSAAAATNARQRLMGLQATTLDTLDAQNRPKTPVKTIPSPGSGLLRPGQTLQQFVPSRGMLYSVFSELDPADTGKITYSTFEEACVLCGLHEDSSRKIFHMLDPDNKGYFTIKDWGAREHEKQTMEFTRLYIHTTRGATGKPAGYHEMKSALVAVQVALHRLKIKNNGRVVSKERLMEAFEFMDTDGSSALSIDELQDGFNAMSIYVTPEVLQEIMDKFDANKDGQIGYREFIGGLYPVLSKGL